MVSIGANSSWALRLPRSSQLEGGAPPAPPEPPCPEVVDEVVDDGPPPAPPTPAGVPAVAWVLGCIAPPPRHPPPAPCAAPPIPCNTLRRVNRRCLMATIAPPRGAQDEG